MQSGYKKTLEKKAIRVVAETEADQEGLVNLIAHVEDRPEYQLVVRSIADPNNRRKSIGTICGELNFPFSKFIKLMSEAKHARAMMRAMDQVSAKLPRVVADIFDNAQNKNRLCRSCKGSGEVPKLAIKSTKKVFNIKQPLQQEDPTETQICWRCEGTGRIVEMAELERQQLAANIGGLVQKNPGLSVNVNNNQPQLVVAGNTPDFRNQTDKWLMEPAVEAELVAAPTTPTLEAKNVPS